MNVKIGCNLLAWSATVSEELYPVVDRLSALGYQGVECAMGSRRKLDYTHFGRHTHNLELEITCVLALGEEVNPISESAKIRDKALDEIKWAIDRAEGMDARILCGPFHSAYAAFSNKPPSVNELNRSVEVLQMAGEYAAQANITLALEAINRFECYLCNTMDQLTDLVGRVGHPNVKAMFDTHHANIEEKKFGQAIRKVGPILGHVHISENDRGTPGDGHIPWEDTFITLAEIGYTGWLTIEAFTRNDLGFANSIHVWREYSKPWEMAEHGLRFIKQSCQKYGL